MKKITSLILAVLMLIPAFACFAFAGGNDANNEVAELSEGYEGTNIISEATLSSFKVEKDGTTPEVSVVPAPTQRYDLSALTDGDYSTGSNTGRTNNYSIKYSFDTPKYFTDLVVYINGTASLPDGTTATESYMIEALTITLYKAGDVVAEETFATIGQTEVVLNAETAADTIVISRDQSHLSTKERGNDLWREVEAYSIEKEFCNVVKSNIASEAFIYGTGTNEGDYCDNWWAWSPKALVDGDYEVGTRSPKGWNYSVVLEFTRDYLISELNLVINGKGTLANSGSLEEVAMNISQIRVRLYNLEGEQVYDSKDIPVDSTEVKIDPYVEASKIKIEIANGKGDGSEYMWEIETFVEEGNHIFEKTGENNPTCNFPGHIEYSCDCGKVIKKSVAATGFHQYDQGVETTPATETDNGVLTKQCYACGEKKEFDIPATGHNWDSGTVTEPTCTKEGYTVYTCTGCGVENCTASYKTDIIEAFGHDWDNGVVTRKASTVRYGEKKFTCARCGEIEYRQTRKLLYTDSVENFEFTESNHTIKVEYEKNSTDGTTYNESSKLYPLQDPKNLLDGDPSTFWHGPTGTTYEITFDREYAFTKGTFYASGNSVFCKIEWINEAGEVTASWTPKWNTINNGYAPYEPLSISLDDSLVGGAVAKTILITITGAKWENGGAFTLSDFDFVTHSCVVDESDYILSGNSYVKPTCTSDGSCIAKCPVCGSETTVVLPKEQYGHNVPSVTPDVEATCSTDGYGHGTCTDCGETIQNVKIPALGTHVYDTEIVFMDAKCGSVGIRQIVCKGCGRVGSQYPIAATNNHTNHWAEDYCASYTADGKLIYVCSGCGIPSDENGVTEKEIAKKVLSKEFLSFIGYSVRTTGYAGIRLTYQIDMEMLAEIEYECDVRIMTYVTDKNGVTKSVESYGKYSKDCYSDDGEFSVVIKPSSYYDEYEIKTVVRLMNFRGVEYVDFDLGALATDSNGKISLCEVAQNVLATSSNLGNNEKAFYEKIVAGK